MELSEGEGVYGRLGTLLFVKGAVKSDSNPEGPYWAAISETLSPDEEPPLVVYKCESGGGLVGFSIPGPGRIHPVSVDARSRIIVNRKAIVAASDSVQLGRMHLEGEDIGDTPPNMFVTVSGSGYVFLHGPGSLVDFNLATNERMVVDGQMILLLEGDVIHEPKPVGKPGQTDPLPYIMLMHLTGPGRVILYSMRNSA